MVAARIWGMTIKKLKIPIYTPILLEGIDPVRIAYGMARKLAQARPTPIMENIICCWVVQEHDRGKAQAADDQGNGMSDLSVGKPGQERQYHQPKAAAKRLYQPNIPLTRLAPSL